MLTDDKDQQEEALHEKDQVVEEAVEDVVGGEHFTGDVHCEDEALQSGELFQLLLRVGAENQFRPEKQVLNEDNYWRERDDIIH